MQKRTPEQYFDWKRVIALAGLLLGATSSRAFAVDYTWNNVGPSEDWYEPRNWLPNGVPGSGDTVRIEGDDPIVSAPTTVSGLYLDGDLRNENLTVLNNATWVDGYIKGSLTIAPGATLSIEGIDSVYINGNLTNNGTVIKNGTGIVYGGGTVQNNGLWQFNTSAGFSANSLTFDNAGTVVKTGSTGETPLRVGSLLNRGRIQAATGNLILFKGSGAGTLETVAGSQITLDGYSFVNGSSISGAGIVDSIGATSIAGPLRLAPGVTFRLSDGVLTGTSGVLSGGGVWDWQGGEIRGQLDTAVNTPSIIGGKRNLYLNGVLSLHGNTKRYLPASSFFFRSGAVLNNYGIYTVQVTPGTAAIKGMNAALATEISQGDIAPRATETGVVNYGTFNVTTDMQTSVLHVNRGTFNVQKNFNLTGTYRQETGTTRLNGGNLKASTISVNGGTVLGTGTLTGPVTNAAIVSPGDAAVGRPFGSLRVDGTYTQAATGTLAIEIGGLNAGSTHDVLQVTGRANLSGSLNLTTRPGFQPLGGQRFGFLTYASRTAQFSAVRGTVFGSGLTYGVEYNAANAQLVVRGVPSIRAISPVSGFTGSAVAIVGTNLADATQVLFGTAAATIVRHEPTRLIVTVPADAQTGRLRVFNPAGNAFSTQSFAVLPRLTAFAPLQASAGALLSLTGSGFNQIQSVSIGGIRVAFTRVSAALIRVTIPATARTGRVEVKTLGGTAVSARVLTLASAPTVKLISPVSGFTGSTVAILGTNLANATQVLFGTAAATIVRREPTRLIVTVPADAQTGRLRVFNPAGNAFSTQSYAVLPRITGFSPLTATRGATLAVTGSGFNQVQSVSIGSVNVAFTRVSSTLISLIVPSNALSGRILVRTPGGLATSAGVLAIRTSAQLAENAAEPVAASSTAELSSVAARATNSTITLQFVRLTDAIRAATGYRVTVNGEAIDVEQIQLIEASATVVLYLPEGSLKAGDRLEVSSSALQKVEVQVC